MFLVGPIIIGTSGVHRLPHIDQIVNVQRSPYDVSLFGMKNIAPSLETQGACFIFDGFVKTAIIFCAEGGDFVTVGVCLFVRLSVNRITRVKSLNRFPSNVAGLQTVATGRME